jgi:hypothetical protein
MIPNRTRSTLGLAALSLALGSALATPILAQGMNERAQMQRAGQSDRMGAALAAMDTDGDGTVSAQERAAHRAARIAALDGDGNGQISRAELLAHAAAEAARSAEARAGAMFDAIDANADGVLSAAEVLAGGGMARMLGRLDANGDGAIGPDERRAMLALRDGAGRPQAHRGHQGHRDGDRAERHKRLHQAAPKAAAPAPSAN